MLFHFFKESAMKGPRMMVAVLAVSFLLFSFPVHAETKTFEERSPISQCCLVTTSAIVSVPYFVSKMAYALTGSLAAGYLNISTLGYAQDYGTTIGTQAVNGDWIVSPRVLTGERCLEFVGRDEPVVGPTLSMNMQQ
jgi:hypothetical protein